MILILGGIGVSSVTRVFVEQKIRSIAILKCVGGTSSRVLAVYLAQVVLLGLAGSVLGVMLAAGVVAAVPSFVGAAADMLQVDYGLSASAAWQGMAVGLLVSVLFSVVPLLEVRKVKPSLLLRNDATRTGGIDWVKWGVAAGVGAALVGVAAWQAGSLRVGLLLSGGFVATAVVLHVCGVALVWAIQPLRYARSFALRQAVLHMVRPGNQTRVILLAVGLGAFFILGVRALQANLLRDFAVQAGPNAPDMFLVDIQPGQRDQVAAVADQANGDRPAPRPIPVLRARVVAVKGANVALENYEQVRGRSGLSREFTVTYRENREANEQVIAGQWWQPGSKGVEVSIEEGLLQRWPIGVGDEMTFDVLGRQITARVASIRRVEWEDFRAGGFMFVFKPGAFDGAPHTYIAPLRGPADTEARARLQASLVSQFPNVSVIDLREILQTIQGIVNNVTLAVTVVGSLVLFSGALILVGAVSMTKFRRVYESAILKTLGASRRLITTMLLLEYGVLGAVAGTVGALGSIALSWAVARFALELPWQATPYLTLAGIVGTAVFVAAVGVIASLDVLRHKPLATLGPNRQRAARMRCSPGARQPSAVLESRDAEPAAGAAGECHESHGRRDLPGRAPAQARGTAGRYRRQAAPVDHGEQLRPPGRHGGPGERQQRSPHPAQAEADGREDPAGDRGSARAGRARHLRRLPRLRRADRRRAAECDSVDARLHRLQGKTERVAARRA